MGLREVPTPQHHISNVLDNIATTVAVVGTGTSASVAIWLANLDTISKLLAIVATLLNIAWVIAQWSSKAKRK